jgi:purine nucleosidase
MDTARKIIIDCDPGIDDAVALCLALFDPRLEVVAVTATPGNVDGHQATRNVQTLIEHLDPPKWPRLGAASITDHVPAAEARHIHGQDGLGDVGLVGAELHHPRPADKVIADVLRDMPGEVSIVTLGPLTNVARAIQRDPDLATMLDRIIMVGGSVSGIGNVTPSAEFNMFCDPEAARAVFRSRTTKTLIPLDVTTQVVLTFDLVDKLPSATTRAGSLLRKIVPFLYRAFRQELGREGILLHDAVGILATLQPELFETEDLAGDVEVAGDLTCGATIFDRRSRPEWRNNMEVATAIDEATATDCILRGLKFAGQCTDIDP